MQSQKDTDISEEFQDERKKKKEESEQGKTDPEYHYRGDRGGSAHGRDHSPEENAQRVVCGTYQVGYRDGDGGVGQYQYHGLWFRSSDG